jgi:hypothetical protein
MFDTLGFSNLLVKLIIISNCPCIFGFHQRRWISWFAKRMAASQDGHLRRRLLALQRLKAMLTLQQERFSAAHTAFTQSVYQWVPQNSRKVSVLMWGAPDTRHVVYVASTDGCVREPCPDCMEMKSGPGMQPLVSTNGPSSISPPTDFNFKYMFVDTSFWTMSLSAPLFIIQIFGDATFCVFHCCLLLKVKLSLYLINKLSSKPLRHGEKRYSATFLDLGTRWRWVVSFTPLPLYHLGKRPWKLGEPQSRGGRCGEDKNLAPAGNRTPAIQSVAYIDWAIPAHAGCDKLLFSLYVVDWVLVYLKHLFKFVSYVVHNIIVCEW